MISRFILFLYICEKYRIMVKVIGGNHLFSLDEIFIYTKGII